MVRRTADSVLGNLTAKLKGAAGTNYDILCL